MGVRGYAAGNVRAQWEHLCHRLEDWVCGYNRKGDRQMREGGGDRKERGDGGRGSSGNVPRW